MACAMRWTRVYGPLPSTRRPSACAEPMRALRVRMVVLLVMLAQEILPIIVAVGRAHDGMDVLTGRRVVVQGDPRLVIELDEDHRAVDPVVERTHLVTGA